MKITKILAAAFLTLVLCANTVFAEAKTETILQDIILPAPVKTGGMPLMDALSARKTERTFSKEALPLEMVSNILWAANGINRPDGKRTAPSAKNLQEIKIFVVLPEGLYAYLPNENALKAVTKDDYRPILGKYPLTLLYVADLSLQSKHMASVDCGFIGQNVYLFSAANGLNAWFRADINQTVLSAKMRLGLSQEVLFAQTVGYPR